MDIEWKANVSIKLKTFVWINFPVEYFKSIPVSAKVICSQIKGKAKLLIPEGTDPLCTFFFVKPPGSQFNVETDIGGSVILSNIGKVKSFILNLIKSKFERNFSHPNGMCFHIPVSKIRSDKLKSVIKHRRMEEQKQRVADLAALNVPAVPQRGKKLVIEEDSNSTPSPESSEEEEEEGNTVVLAEEKAEKSASEPTVAKTPPLLPKRKESKADSVKLEEKSAGEEKKEIPQPPARAKKEESTKLKETVASIGDAPSLPPKPKKDNSNSELTPDSHVEERNIEQTKEGVQQHLSSPPEPNKDIPHTNSTPKSQVEESKSTSPAEHSPKQLEKAPLLPPQPPKQSSQANKEECA